MAKHAANTTEADVEAIHTAEPRKSQYLVGTKDVSEVYEGEKALPGLLQRLKEPCYEAVTFRYFLKLRSIVSADIVAVWVVRSKAATVRYFWITHSCFI